MLNGRYTVAVDIRNRYLHLVAVRKRLARNVAPLAGCKRKEPGG